MAKKNEGPSTKELTKMWRREAALHYAATNKIELADDPTDEELVAAIETFVRLKLKGRKEGDKYCCIVKLGGCGHYIQDDDKYCWFCGQDSSEDGDSGGFDGVVGSTGDAEEAPAEEDDTEAYDALEPINGDEGEPAADDDEVVDEVDLDECTERIITLSRDSGVNAYDIGFELHRVNVTKAYKQGKHKTFEDYCKKVLGMERGSAYNYIGINKRFERDEIGGLTYEKLLALSKIKDDKQRQKLLKAAKPKSEGGKSMTRKELKEKVKEYTSAQPPGRSPGRTLLPRYRKFVGDSAKGEFVNAKKDRAIVKDEEVFGKGIGLEVRVLKNSVSVEVVELSEEE